MVITFGKLFQISVFVLFFSTLRCSSKEKGINEAVIEELASFVGDYIDVAADAFVESNRQKKSLKDDCMTKISAIHYRYRCCVYYSNAGFILLENRYGDSPALPDFWESFQRGKLPDDRESREILLTPLYSEFNRVGVEKVEAGKFGVYSSVLTILGHKYRMNKCDISSVHTYLLLSPMDNDALEEIIVDLSIKQFFVVPDWMEESDFESAVAKEVEQDSKGWFVGTKNGMLGLLSKERIRRNMEDILSKNDPRWKDFDNVMNLIPLLVRKEVQDQFCGKSLHFQPKSKGQHQEL